MRSNTLDVRHRALGAALEGGPYNDLEVPWAYRTDPFDEVVATRTRVALYDVTAILTAHVSGPDAAAVIDHLVSGNCSAMAPGTAMVTSELDAAGHVVDDMVVQRLSEQSFRLCHGGGATPGLLAESAAGRAVAFHWDDELNLLAVQGPRTASLLQPHSSIDLNRLAWFEHTEAELFGRKVRLFRGGFTGEDGFEVACPARDAVPLWDALIEAGQPDGITAASWGALNALRIESGLLFFPLDMPEGDVTPWELGMGWTLPAKAADFRGRRAVLAAKGKERFRAGGLTIAHDAAVDGGARILLDGQDVGVVTSASYSRYLMQSIALVHLAPAAQVIGTVVQVRQPDGQTFDARVARSPFYDPRRRRVAVGPPRGH